MSHGTKLPFVGNALYRWMAPHRMAFWFFLPLFIVYWVIPDDIFWWYWRTERLGDLKFSLYFLFCIFAFAMASWFGAMVVKAGPIKRRRTAGSVYARDIPLWYIRTGLFTSIFAYLIWFVLGAYRAGGVGSLLAIRAVNPWYVKSVLMQTIPGVTTLTHVASIAIPLTITSGRWGRVERWLTLTIVILAFIQSELNLERLGLLEVVLPPIFLLAASRRTESRKILSVVVVIVLVVFLFFAFSEATRTFLAKEISGPKEIIEEGFYRFVAYYVTSINNAFLFMKEYAFETPFYTVLRPLWKFPGLTGLYKSFAGVSPIHLPTELAASSLNPEYNTASAIGCWIADFGFLVAWVWAAFMGLLSGTLWRLAPFRPSIAALYGVWFVGLLEFMRIPYFTSTRLFPVYLFLIGATLLKGFATKSC